MKLIFSVDAIFPPLTGIGRYAWELARRLERSPDLEEVRFFSTGRWVRWPDLDGAGSGENGPGSSGSARLAAALRRRLSRQVWAVHGYNAIVPPWMRYRLRPFSDSLFHSPNFFVPPFSGRSIATIHDLSIYKYPETHPPARRRLFDLQMEGTLSRVSHLITDSEATRREVIDQFGWPQDRISAVHLGVDPVFSPRPAEVIEPVLRTYELTPGGYALCVSTMEPRKRIGALLTAYETLPAALRARYPLVFAGDSGWLNESIHHQLRRAEEVGWARRLGYVPGDDLPAIYRGARAFFYPSIYEGFGLPVLEAMASGIPVMTSNRSSLPEVANGAAWLVNPDDIDGMRAGVLKVLEDTDWRSGAVARGLAVAAGRTWERCAASTIDVYAKVAAG